MKKYCIITLIICCLASFSNFIIAQPNFRLAGFATENGGTKGGLGGTFVTVNTYAALKRYAQSSSPYIIAVQGTITNGSGGGQIDVNSNKTIVGLGNDAMIQGIGIAIGSENNIIIQNLKITLVGLTTPKNTNDGDCISIYGSSKNIWIDHCELFSEDPDIQTNIDKYDGLIDIKQKTGFITISWCYWHDHHKGGLVGSSEQDLYADRKITFHHNYYRKVKLRLPMYRGSTGHFFNNYIVEAKDATEIRANTCVRVEKNYYEALHYSIYTPNDAPGKTERIDNIEVSHASRPYPANCVADITYDYADVLTDQTRDVKTIVPQWAGVGKLAMDCYGEVLGEAFVDDCGTCVGGNTGLEACTDVAVNTINSESPFLIYPNPTKGELNISLKNAPESGTEIMLYDQAGRLVLHEELQSNNLTLNVEALERGVYIVKASSTNNKTFRSLVILQ